MSASVFFLVLLVLFGLVIGVVIGVRVRSYAASGAIILLQC